MDFVIARPWLESLTDFVVNSPAEQYIQNILKYAVKHREDLNIQDEVPNIFLTNDLVEKLRLLLQMCFDNDFWMDKDDLLQLTFCLLKAYDTCPPDCYCSLTKEEIFQLFEHAANLRYENTEYY